MSLDLTSYDSALKQYYGDQTVENMVYKNNPFLALIKKFEQMEGRNYPLPTLYGNPQGRSASFSRAQTRGAVSNSQLQAFLMTRVKDYSIATIDNETILASRSNMGAFMEAATLEINGAINSLTRSVATSMFKSGYGDIGVVTGSVAGTSISLANGEDVVNFEVGMELDCSLSQASNVLKAYGTSGNGLIITGVNRSLGSESISFAFAVNDATNGIPTIAAGDYLFVRGDRQNSATPAKLKLAGLQAWLPATAPSVSDSFFNVNRSSDVTRLAGQRLVATGAPIEEALIDLSAIIAREGGMPDHAFVSFSKYAQLEKSLGSKVQYIDLKVNAEIGFKGILVNGVKGPIKVIPDQNCPTAQAFMLQLDTWKLGSIGKAVRVIDTDSLQMLRQASADGVECRYGFYGNLMCNAPGYSGIATL
jgi:hypothetical protein